MKTATKTTTAHTPGPWHVSGNRVVAESTATVLADVWSPCPYDPRGEQRNANAHLIASAPALIAACKAALAALELADQDRYDGGKLTGQLREAIAQAEKI